MKIFLLIFVVFIMMSFTQTKAVTTTSVKEKNTVSIQIEHPKQATFFQTLLRTPFALVGATLTLFTVLIIGLIEFWGYLFSGFDYNFPITNEIIAIGWKGIVHDWWYQPAVGWHLVVASIFWVVLFGRKRK